MGVRKAGAVRRAGETFAQARARAEAAKAESDGRKADKPLYVMLTEEQKTRYEQLAKDNGMKLRELVVNAIEAFASARNEQVHGRGSQVSDPNVLLESGYALSPNVIPGGIDVPWMMRAVTALVGRVGTLERDTLRLNLRFAERRGNWRHTHNASVTRMLVPLYGENHGRHLLLFERESMHPTWAIDMEGRLDRLDGDEPGIVVEAA